MPAKNTVKDFRQNSYYHIYNCGIENRRIFENDQDYQTFIRYLKIYLTPVEILAKVEPSLRKHLIKNNLSSDVKLLAYCLMPNHFHLLIWQKSKDAASRLMRALTTAYSMYFNKRYNRQGSLFQGIYKASKPETDQQLQYITRHIHKNPQEQAISVSNYQWSSYQNFLGNHYDSWLDPHKILEYFNRSNPNSNYANFVEIETDLPEGIEKLLLD